VTGNAEMIDIISHVVIWNLEKLQYGQIYLSDYTSLSPPSLKPNIAGIKKNNKNK